MAFWNTNPCGKETTAYAYDLLAKWMGVEWQKPRYKAVRKLPFIPHEMEIDDLIAGCNNTSQPYYKSSKKQVLEHAMCVISNG